MSETNAPAGLLPPLAAYKKQARAELKGAAETVAPLFKAMNWKWGGYGRPERVPDVVDIYDSLNDSLERAHAQLVENPEMEIASSSTGRFCVRVWRNGDNGLRAGMEALLELAEVDLPHQEET